MPTSQTLGESSGLTFASQVMDRTQLHTCPSASYFQLFPARFLTYLTAVARPPHPMNMNLRDSVGSGTEDP